MVIVREKKIEEGSYIRGNFNPAIMVLEILKNTQLKIRESSLLYLGKFLDTHINEGIPITMTFMTPNGSNDVGEIQGYDKRGIFIAPPGQVSPYNFPIADIQKVYNIVFPGGGEGYFCMGKRHNSIYLRDYS